MKIFSTLFFFLFSLFTVAQQYSWTQRSNLPAAQRYNPIGFSFQSKGYIGLGLGNTVTLNDLWEYNDASDAWTQKASFPGTARYGAACFVIGEFAYVGCGWSPSPQVNFFRYHIPTNT